MARSPISNRRDPYEAQSDRIQWNKGRMAGVDEAKRDLRLLTDEEMEEKLAEMSLLSGEYNEGMTDGYASHMPKYIRRTQ